MARAVCVALVVRGDAVEILETGRDKGACLSAARTYAETAKPSALEEVYVLACLGGAIQFRRRIAPAPAPAVDPAEEARELRRILKDAGVPYSPNSGLDRLREQVAALEAPEA